MIFQFRANLLKNIFVYDCKVSVGNKLLVYMQVLVCLHIYTTMYTKYGAYISLDRVYNINVVHIIQSL